MKKRYDCDCTMIQKFLFLPEEFAKQPVTEIGTYAKELLSLILLDIPLTKTVVLPRNTLRIIAQTNNLQTKIYQLIQDTNYASENSKNETCKKIEKLILKQRIPNEIAKSLVITYHNYFNNCFISTKNSELLPFSNVEVNHIHSDTNFVDAILETWAKIVCQKIKRLSLSTNSIHELLFPSPILIREQLEPKVSGIAYSYDLDDGSKNKVTILSTWGVYHPDNKEFDHFSIDTRTNNVVKQKTKTQKNQLRRVLGKLVTEEVLEKYQNKNTINENQLKTIADLVSRIKKKYLSQIEVLWGIQNNKIFIESLKESDPYLSKSENNDSIFFKIYSTVNSSVNITKKTSSADGIAIYNSGTFLSETGTHPNKAAKTKQKKYLIESITKTLIKYSEKTNKPLIYRANNFTSNEFRELKFSSIYESIEINPLLGFRGGLRFLSQQDAFKLELEAIKRLSEKTNHEISLLLPFIRSSDELYNLIKIIDNYGLTKRQNFSILMELSTPENIFNLKNYPIKKIRGLVINFKNLNALSTGVDPNNSEILVHYPQNNLLLKTYVESAIESAKQVSKTLSINHQPIILIDLADYNKELLEDLCSLEINGFIVNEQVTQQVKECIIETQRNKIL